MIEVRGGKFSLHHLLLSRMSDEKGVFFAVFFVWNGIIYLPDAVCILSEEGSVDVAAPVILNETVYSEGVEQCHDDYIV